MTTRFQIDGIDIHVDGAGPEAIVMIHGWPDTHRLWDSTVEALRHRYRCVRFTLPGFNLAQPRRPTSVAQMSEFIRRVVEHTSPGQRVTLLLHDWGAVFGYAFAMQHPQLVARVIGVDIGDAASPAHLASLGLRAKLGMAGYQLWLMLAWRIGGERGDRMTRWMARALRCRTDPAAIGCTMNYPYDMAWTGSHGGLKQLKSFRPSGPMLFIYGRRKRFMFHSEAWARSVAERPGNQVLALPAGHWVMVDQPEAFQQAVLAWLDASSGSTAAAGAQEAVGRPAD